jgi:hypothetical protein
MRKLLSATTADTRFYKARMKLRLHLQWKKTLRQTTLDRCQSQTRPNHPVEESLPAYPKALAQPVDMSIFRGKCFARGAASNSPL